MATITAYQPPMVSRDESTKLRPKSSVGGERRISFGGERCVSTKPQKKGRKVGFAAEEVEWLGERKAPATKFSNMAASTHPHAKTVDVLELDAGSSGWRLRIVGDTSALSWHDSLRFANTVLGEADIDGRCAQAYCVRGNVPWEDARAMCKCVNLVRGGISMHVPGKLFGRNFIELAHEKQRVVLAVDAAGALQRWAVLSRQLVDDRRAGRPAWTGWSAGADSYRAQIFKESGTKGFLTRREEWDWTYRTDYAPVALSGKGGTKMCGEGPWSALWDASGGLCAKPGGSLGLGKKSGEGAAASEAATSTAIKEGTALEWEMVKGEEPTFDLSAVGAMTTEQEVKIFEDYLDEMGLANLTARVRVYEMGWELRMRWWAVVNPLGVKARGTPHCRLRDTTLQFVDGEDYVTRVVHERSLTIDNTPEAVIENGAISGADLVDADAIYPRMKQDLLEHHRLPLDTELPTAAAAAAQLSSPPTTMTRSSPTVVPAVSLGAVPEATAIAPAIEGGNGTQYIALGGGSGDVLLVADGRIAWRRNGVHDRLEAVALMLAPGENSGVVLTAATDGHVRAWSVADGADAGACAIEGAVGADSERRGLCIVSSIASAWCAVAGRAAVAAAAGRSVFLLDVAVASASNMCQLQASCGAALWEPLPSVVEALAISSGGEDGAPRHLCVAAGPAGVFVFANIGSTMREAPPVRHLTCGGSVVSLAVVTAGEEQCALQCLAGNSDRSLRLWDVNKAELLDGEAAAENMAIAIADKRPLTFGGGAGVVRDLAVVGGAGAGSALLPVVAFPDGSAGAVVWRLGGAPMGPQALGVDSALSERLSPPSERAAVAVALDSAASSTPVVRLAVGYNNGSAVVYKLTTPVTNGTAWHRTHECVPPAAAMQALSAASGTVSLAIRGEWLYLRGAGDVLTAWNV
jgi:hypothetical protein